MPPAPAVVTVLVLMLGQEDDGPEGPEGPERGGRRGGRTKVIFLLSFLSNCLVSIHLAQTDRSGCLRAFP